MNSNSMTAPSCMCQSWNHSRPQGQTLKITELDQSTKAKFEDSVPEISSNTSSILNAAKIAQAQTLCHKGHSKVQNCVTCNEIAVCENMRTLLLDDERFNQNVPDFKTKYKQDVDKMTEPHTRKGSLPAVMSDIDAQLVQRTTPKFSVLATSYLSFARCRRNRVPRITYSQSGDSTRVASTHDRPIYPSLPFSPFCSPNSSPNLQRNNQKPSHQCRRISLEPTPTYAQVNQYRVEGEIGRGSFGVVKLAYNTEDNNHYAMKIMSKKKLMRRAGLYGRMPPPRDGQKSRPSPLEQLHREIAVLKKLNHPNIVRLYEVLNDADGDNLYMVFQLVHCGPVIQLPTNDPLPEMKAWQYFRDIVMGIEYLHYQKIIHRDIKPSNLLLSDDERIQISDFGVCNQFEGMDALLSDTAGTPAFVSPEALKETRARYSGKALDIWQMGVSLYSFVFGHVPFDDTNVLALYTKIRSEPLTFPSRSPISANLIDLLKGMLKKEPSERMKLADIKVHPWVTQNDLCPLPPESENCTRIEVTEDDIKNSIRLIPKIDTLVLIKSMIKKHSFSHPFKDNIESGGKSKKHNTTEGTFEKKLLLQNSLPALLEICSTEKSNM